jgi:hypothetical protein
VTPARPLTCHGTLRAVKEQQLPHVTLAGDRDGDYVIREQRPDGTLVLAPETAAQASLRRIGARAATSEEFDAFLAEHGEDHLPADAEG